MFEIKFRIIEDEALLKEWDAITFDLEGDLEGFFALKINNKSYGYYHDNVLKDGEVGFELITQWFENLINVSIMLKNSNYVALSDIESYNTWIEFKLINKDNLLISIIENDKKDGFNAIVTTKFKEYSYSEWRNASITLEEFEEEVISKTESYINCIININPKLIESKRIINLRLLIEKINNAKADSVK